MSVQGPRQDLIDQNNVLARAAKAIRDADIHWRQLAEQMERERNSAYVENQRLREALEKFGAHTDINCCYGVHTSGNCAVNDGPAGYHCACGLNAALKA